jgi:hypothetical protein
LNQRWILSNRLLSTLAARQLALRFGGDCGSADWRHLGRLAGFTNQKKERRLKNGLQPFVKLRSCGGHLYSAADEFLCDLEGLRQEILSQRELQKIAQSRWRATPSVRASSGPKRYAKISCRAPVLP